MSVDKKLAKDLKSKDCVWVEIETNKGENHYYCGVKLTRSYRGSFSFTDFKKNF